MFHYHRDLARRNYHQRNALRDHQNEKGQALCNFHNVPVLEQRQTEDVLGLETSLSEQRTRGLRIALSTRRERSRRHCYRWSCQVCSASVCEMELNNFGDNDFRDCDIEEYSVVAIDAARINHSCLPNAHFHYDKEKHLGIVRAATYIAKGEPADARMKAAAIRRGVKLTSISRPICPSDFEEFDLILAMDKKNKGICFQAHLTSLYAVYFSSIKTFLLFHLRILGIGFYQILKEFPF